MSIMHYICSVVCILIALSSPGFFGALFYVVFFVFSRLGPWVSHFFPNARLFRRPLLLLLLPFVVVLCVAVFRQLPCLGNTL